LTVVCDHVTGKAIWAAKGRSKATVGELAHLPDLRLGVGESSDEGRDTLGQPDAAHREGSAAAHARLGVAQQPDQIQGRRHGGTGGGHVGRRHVRRRVPEHAPILEPEDQGDLLLVGGREHRRGGGHAGAR
jgi:hypothetical protein